MKRKWRLYLDASVFGGCFDSAEGREEDSRRVLNYCVVGRATLITSSELEEELADAPERVVRAFTSVPAEHIEAVDITGEVSELADAYLAAGVVGSVGGLTASMSQQPRFTVPTVLSHGISGTSSAWTRFAPSTR